MTIAAIESLNIGLDYLAEAARDRNHELLLLTGDRSRYVHELRNGVPRGVQIIDIDTADVDLMIKFLADVDDLAGVLRFLDQRSDQSLAVAQRLGLPHEDPAAVALLRDKGRLRRHLFERGFSRSPGLVFAPGDIEAVNFGAFPFPCVIKDVRGDSSRNVWLVESPSDLDRVLAEARTTHLQGGDLVSEPYFAGPLYSAETVTWDGVTRILGVTSRGMSPRPYLREETASFPVALPEPDRDRLAEWLGRILASAGYHSGITHTEFIWTAYGFEIVEINTRLGGALIAPAVNAALGVNFHGAAVDLALGRRPQILDELGDARHGVGMVALYVPRTGIFERLDGTELLPTQPGSPRVYSVSRPGDLILSTTDQRGVVAFLSAFGPTAELSLHRALAAAGRLEVVMR